MSERRFVCTSPAAGSSMSKKRSCEDVDAADGERDRERSCWSSRPSVAPLTGLGERDADADDGDCTEEGVRTPLPVCACPGWTATALDALSNNSEFRLPSLTPAPELVILALALAVLFGVTSSGSPRASTSLPSVKITVSECLSASSKSISVRDILRVAVCCEDEDELVEATGRRLLRKDEGGGGELTAELRK